MRLTRPAKLHDEATGRYLRGTVVDYSPGGAMLEVGGGSRLRVGQRVAVGIAERAEQPMLRSAEMIRAVVVRGLGHGDVQHVALAFEEVGTLAEAG